MWYFSWILGLGLAMTFGILNAIWYEVREGENAPTVGSVPGRSRRRRP